MEYVIGILLLISFFGLAIYCIKGHNLMIGFLVMSVLWTILPLVGNWLVTNPEFIAANEGIKDITIISVLNTVFQSAPEAWGTTLVNILWGAWFGRVLMETGVAATIIRKTVELGGDRPIITVTLLNIVTTIIFSSMTGVGPVIAIGVIVLPIMMSLGVKKPIALFSFMGSIAAGTYINPVIFTQYRAYFLEPSQMIEFNLSWYTKQWGIYACIVMLIVTTIVTGIAMTVKKPGHSWAAQTPKQTDNNAPFPALITPLIPVLGAILLNLSVILGFIIGGFYAMLLCGRLKGGFKKVCQLVNKLYYDGVVDTAPLVGFVLTLPMFNKVATYCAPYFRAVVGNVIPQSTLLICIIFAIIACFGLFRGPMTLVGCGAATLGVVRSLGFSVPFLYACFAIPTITMNNGSCITQSWIAWGLSYSKVESKDFLKLSIPNGYIISIIMYTITYFVFGR
jgi:hypothetical protein